MEDIHKWTIQTERSIYNELKHMSIDEGKTINEFCKPAIELFKNELVNIIERTQETRRHQKEEAQLVESHPLHVSGQEEDPLAIEA